MEKKKVDQNAREEVDYYKKKYEEMSNQNMEMTEKICNVQRENTEQINKSTELMRENYRLQEDMKVKQ